MKIQIARWWCYWCIIKSGKGITGARNIFIKSGRNDHRKGCRKEGFDESIVIPSEGE